VIPVIEFPSSLLNSLISSDIGINANKKRPESANVKVETPSTPVPP
jgi:hypothetical protein